ncbi:MAG: lipoprotein [Steroidobacteraceae bacterium]|jgi:predicted small lipoprotein YifL|nr:lipoprotein [Steroidobacteraceae bacterium]
MRRLPLIFAAALVAACGQTGPLFLPDESIETPVEIRGPAPAAPEAPPQAPAPPTPAEEQAEEPDGDEPPGPIAP